MRLPVAEGFYPADAMSCRKMVKEFINVDISVGKITGAVVPHAGYVYSGKVAGYVYKAISKQKPRRIVIFGTNHTGRGMPLALSRDVWRTTLGEVEVDVEFVDKVAGDLLQVDEVAHMYEHSIEVQLPFLQVCCPDVKIVPISVSHVSFDLLSNVSKRLVDKGTIYIASSDFTHYGLNYGFAPKDSEKNPVAFVENTDKALIKLITSMKAEEFYKESQKTTICGAAGITLMLLIVKELGVNKGRLLKYDTSYSTSRDTSAIVGYAGIAL